MKKFVPYIIGVVVLFVLVYLGQGVMKNREVVKEEEMQTAAPSRLVEGQVKRVFEGEHVLDYGFDVSETATTSVEKDGALVKVTEADVLTSAMYFSYEGGRGYSPADYITNVIVPNVSAVTSKGTTTIGAFEWDVVESEWSVWRVAKTLDGTWLIVVENKKGEDEKALAVIESLTAK